ncbi:MAG: hypothetical protein GY845_14175 [Planctomycetes bacterium]|nr:hypothetical protein [Planctomycetota bacterium]
MSDSLTSLRATKIRLFLTCWLVFTLHFATDFVREHYLVISIVDDCSFRLDKYVGLHHDIFETPGYGAHHGANPGASMIAAIPYIAFKPFVDRIVNYQISKRVAQSAEENKAVYKDHRPARVRFYNEIRKRGLDVKFGLVCCVTMVFCMAPFSAFGVVVIFNIMNYLGLSKKLSLFMAFLYAFGTPVFFRTGYLNQNLMVGIFGLTGFVLLWQPGNHSRLKIWQRYGIAGLLSGMSVLCDYSGLVVLLMIFGYGLLRKMDSAALRQALKNACWYIGGAIGPILLLWFYQWQSFGHPLYPGQHHMPPVDWVEIGYRGVGGPSIELIRMLLFDYRFGLFVMSPILLLAFAAPILSRFKKNIVPLRETLFILAFFIAFTLFLGCIQYTRLQWVTGIRYIIPVIPFLFLLVASVIIQLPRILAYGLAVFAFAQAWCMSMVRSVGIKDEGVINSVVSVFLDGFQLPWLNTLSKMARQYVPFLEENNVSPISFFILWGVIIYGIWRIKYPFKTLKKETSLIISEEKP